MLSDGVMAYGTHAYTSTECNTRHSKMPSTNGITPCRANSQPTTVFNTVAAPQSLQERNVTLLGDEKDLAPHVYKPPQHGQLSLQSSTTLEKQQKCVLVLRRCHSFQFHYLQHVNKFTVHTFAPHACSNDNADGPKSGGLAPMEADR